MELTFDKTTGICEFEVTADFNLHIERDTPGSMHIYQRTAGGEYTFVDDQGYLSAKEVIDYDFQSLVYPKYIKIKSSVLPSVAVVTTDGEVNELKFQSKSVKIESNGTTSVTPDAGYNGLSEVSVEVNVPTEGGGSSGGPTLFSAGGGVVDFENKKTYINNIEDDSVFNENTLIPSQALLDACYYGSTGGARFYTMNLSLAYKLINITIIDGTEYEEEMPSGSLFLPIPYEGELKMQIKIISLAGSEYILDIDSTRYES